ncbi:radical SAM family heme chaperone HemW [Nonlabens ponticola]|uniref:Heme chaperone HemW n=1 Tax=Nonlabens ponticola TaxID=2496866 RepID=A0A3S9MUM1_9FLAO|nr:radical SAM family heme chaperone HemW [Nonlabens ponticola]AZQ42877.1 radical SAM family heme chaperone HemW [Nonlabens ponticola]
MASIYIHIPFCKQACHYCDFHFVTSLKNKSFMINALCEELRLRRHEFKDVEVSCIYFGGGTPSVLEVEEIDLILKEVFNLYNCAVNLEITLEANPDDLTPAKIESLAASQINRLSIGVQSFHEQDLKLMNRAHNAIEAMESIQLSRKLFPNISIDLIYGIPGLTDEQWRENLYQAIELDVPHISSYALTVEDGTALKKFIDKGVMQPVDDEQAQRQFNILLDVMQLHGYENYEFSNFSKKGFFSRNNTAYWTGKSYLGIGPSAHSFDGNRRAWNINNNVKYIKAIEAGNLPQEVEELTIIDRYNEYVMTGLRTVYGVSLVHVEKEYGLRFREYLLEQAATYLKDHLLYLDDKTLLVTRKGKFLSDGIASELFMLNLTS